MSLLDDNGALYQDITIYPQISWTDDDGNTATGPSPTGIPGKARFFGISFLGTGSKAQESQQVGFQTVKVLQMRMPRGAPILGAQAQIEWNGDLYNISGDPTNSCLSEKTAHVEYFLERF